MRAAQSLNHVGLLFTKNGVNAFHPLADLDMLWADILAL
jgi:hypothetical protein